MTNTFLNFISGGETGKLLGSCLSDQNKQKMFSAVSGSKRYFIESRDIVILIFNGMFYFYVIGIGTRET